MEKEQIDLLAKRCLNGQASAREHALMEEYLRRLGDLPSGLTEEEIAMVEKELHLRMLKSLRLEPAVLKIMLGKKFVAAAALLICFTGVLYFSLSKKASNTPLALSSPAKSTPILPGSDKAVLTLSDGSSVPIGSDVDLLILKEGNAKIQNSSGVLNYEALNNPHRKIVYNTMTTPKGGQYQLILSDGSKVWLNSLSSIHFPTVFTGPERKVVVTGEAYFEVAADARHPFHVTSGGADIEVLGTHFNVNAYTDELMMKTTLLEGSVKVRKGSEASIVSSGQQLQIVGKYGGGTQLRLVRDADMEQAVAWKNGLFYLKGANIKEIMRQISRWYNVNIYYHGDVSNIDFYGVVSRRKSVEELLEIMEKTGIVHFKLEGSNITVSK